MAQQPLTIIGSYTSPFVRAVRVACAELNLPYQLEVTGFFPNNTAEQTAHIDQNNPLQRVPVLIDGPETVIDSRIIVAHLIRTHGNGNAFCQSLPQNAAQENILSVLHGTLDAAILWFILKNTQPGITLDEGYAARSLARAQGSLAWLDAHWQAGDTFGVAESLLVCALEWLEKRRVADWRDHANLVAVHRQYAERASLVATRIPEQA